MKRYPGAVNKNPIEQERYFNAAPFIKMKMKGIVVCGLWPVAGKASGLSSFRFFLSR